MHGLTIAEAADNITTNCGEKAKQAILARDVGPSRLVVLHLAMMKQKGQQKAIQELLGNGNARSCMLSSLFTPH